MYHFKLEKFEGPLDLLLKLIQEERFDITEISLARVADEYLKYVEANQEISPEELADFLVVATKLLLLKSRLLVPDVPLEEEDAGDLATQLRIYREYLQASQNLEKIIANKPWAFWRTKAVGTITPSFSPGQDLNAAKLYQTFLGIIKSLEKIVVLPQSVMEKTVSLQEKIQQLKILIKNSQRLSFKSVMGYAQSRAEMIVSFLALLELVKQQEVHVQQEENFGEILIKSVR